jgi:Glycyl-tRNA synthetase (class II)
MAEIEHFVNGDDKSHPKFENIANNKLWLLDHINQNGKNVAKLMTVREAVKRKIINNQTLVYYMARTALFLHAVGIRKSKLKFRQRKSDEMAHYVSDCWDAEVKTTCSWIERVGHADLSAYDLQAHSEKSGDNLNAYEVYNDPKIIRKLVVKPNQVKLGQKYKKNKNIILNYSKQLENDESKLL